MPNILVAGAGKIGAILAHILASSEGYQVFLADIDIERATANIPMATRHSIEAVALDVREPNNVVSFAKKNNIDAIVSCLPYFCNVGIAEIAHEANTHYFDLTEDVHSTNAIQSLSKGSKKAFVSQCGLAPGMINIIGNDLIGHFDTVDTVKLRCGALPVTASNSLLYSLTWSTDGLINEYGNPCEVVENYEKTQVSGLSNLEEIQIDGLSYEAFCTSGGLGSLADTYAGKIKTMNYKSVRYPGHCEKMRFLMQGLKLNDDRETLKKILETALPGTEQDVVLVYASVTGHKDGRFLKQHFVQKFYPIEINGQTCAGIQSTTACSACAIIDITLDNPDRFHGHVKQEQYGLQQLQQNRFGRHLQW